MKCPVCGAVYRPSKGAGEKGGDEILSISLPAPNPSLNCRRCKTDLSDLIRLYDQSIWYHRQALYLFSQGYYSEAGAYNNSAIALNDRNADFHTLAGKLGALRGEFRQAIASWQQALKFDPQNAIVCNCLQMIESLK
jgi:tetratricopeptide (TPR) repeat protein